MARAIKGIILWALLLFPSIAAATAIEGEALETRTPRPPLANERCLRCHADQEEKITIRPDGTEHNVYVDTGVLDHGAHAKVSCVGCHTAVDKMPHSKPLPKAIACISCHQNPVTKSKESAKLAKETDDYLHSVHAKPNPKDHSKTSAACRDCHKEGHSIPTKGTPERAAYRLSGPEVCGTCHEKEKKDYLTSAHGKLWADKKDEKTAVCSDCHGMHNIGDPKSDAAQLAITNNCGACHKEAEKTYLASYHGQVKTLGYTNVAQCFDCHGGHNIQNEKDPTSTLHQNNRLKTCNNCHKNAGDGFLSFQAHGNPSNFQKYPGLFIANLFMEALIIGVMVFFWAHVLLWLYRELMDRKKGIGYVENLDQPETVYFRRFNPAWRWIHTLFAIATMVLGLTGTSILFAHTTWAKTFVSLIGGPQVEAIMHRVAAVIWLGIFIFHLVIAFKNIMANKDKFEWFGSTSMLPNLKDAHDLVNMFRWFLGKGPRPEFDRWTYWQKFDYWAPFWGVMVIGLSGMVLFAPNKMSAILPGWMFNIAQLVHAEEALLAMVFLNTVHFFNVHFRPSRFPMSTTIFTGAIPLEEFKHDHRIEYERLVKNGELEKYLVKRISRRTDLLSSFLASVLIISGLTLLTLVLIGRFTMN